MAISSSTTEASPYKPISLLSDVTDHFDAKLPSEMIVKISSYLKGKDIAAFEVCCTRFYAILREKFSHSEHCIEFRRLGNLFGRAFVWKMEEAILFDPRMIPNPVANLPPTPDFELLERKGKKYFKKNLLKWLGKNEEFHLLFQNRLKKFRLRSLDSFIGLQVAIYFFKVLDDSVTDPWLKCARREFSEKIFNRFVSDFGRKPLVNITSDSFTKASSTLLQTFTGIEDMQKILYEAIMSNHKPDEFLARLVHLRSRAQAVPNPQNLHELAFFEDIIKYYLCSWNGKFGEEKKWPN